MNFLITLFFRKKVSLILFNSFLFATLLFHSSTSFEQIVTTQVWEKNVDGFNTLSSPKVIDLNDNNILDVVIGYSSPFATTNTVNSGVIAFDGTNGVFYGTLSIIWEEYLDIV